MMADKKSLFAGRSGERSGKRSPKRNTTTKASTETASSLSPPPPPASEEKKQPVSYSRGGLARGVAASSHRRELEVKEAEEFLKQANKCLQKTMTRWNPNFFAAAPLFEKAAACYRAAGEDSKATAMYMQAGECQSHDSVSAHASAAKDFREAALITERQGRGEEAAALYMRCAEAWVHADEAGRAADYLGRSAKLIEKNDEEAAAERYVQASKVMVPKGSDARTNFVRVVGGCDILVKGIRFLAATKRFEECMQVVRRYCIILQAENMDHSLGRMYLTYCVLALAMGDFVKADTAFRDVHLQSTTYLRSEECRVEEELLMAFKDFDPDLLAQAQGDRTLRRLETEIVRLAKSLKISEDDEGDEAPARQRPSGTISAAQARVEALREKYGDADSASTTPSSSSSPSSPTVSDPPNPPATVLPPSASSPTANLKNTTTETAAAEGSGAESWRTAFNAIDNNDSNDVDDGDDAAAKDALFGGTRKGQTMSSPAGVFPDITGATVATIEGDSLARSSSRGDAPEGLVEAGDTVDLGLGDLEASLEAPGEDDDDLDAMIEAARKEAEALGLGGGEGEGEQHDHSDEEDLDLT